MEFDFNIKVLKLVGFFVPTEEKASNIRITWFYISLLPCTLVYVLTIAYYAVETRSNIELRIWLVYHIVNAIQTHIRRLYFVFKIKEITELLKLITVPCDSESSWFDRCEREMKIGSTKKIRWFSTVMLIYNLCSTMGLVIVPAVVRVLRTLVSSLQGNDNPKDSRTLIVQTLWPSDPQELPTFYFVMAWQCYWFILCSAFAFTSDAFMCSLMLAASERSAFLARVAPRALLPGPWGQVTPHCRAWIRYHQHYLRIVKTINHVTAPFIFLIHAIAVLNLIMYAFALLQFTDSVTAPIAIINMVGVLIRIFIYATAGQTILDQSVQLRHSVLTAPQVSRGGLGAGPSRSVLQVVVTRVAGGARPEEVNGLGFFTVCIEFFTSVLSAAFSYLMVLLEFK